MIIKDYYGEKYSLWLCDFDINKEMFFRLSVYPNENGWAKHYIFETRNLGINKLDRGKFKKTIEKYNIKLDAIELMNIIEKFYPFNQYINVVGL